MAEFIHEVTRSLERHEPKPVGEQRCFAVLLPLIYTDDEWQILYEVRSKTVSQPGETSFPGGAIEPGECPSDAAIRETMEELCLERDNIDILGELDFVVSDTTIIYCFVGVIQGVRLEDVVVNQEEVQEIFTLSLSWLCCHPPTYYSTLVQADYDDDFPVSRLPGGRSYKWSRRKNVVGFYDIPDSGYNLWGFTAKMTDRFVRFIKESGVYDCVPCLEKHAEDEA